jgi:hypothetical protein
VDGLPAPFQVNNAESGVGQTDVIIGVNPGAIRTTVMKHCHHFAKLLLFYLPFGGKI